MNLLVTPVMWIMAAAPIVMLLFLMLVRNWCASKAAGISVILCAVIGVLFYKADLKLLVVEASKGIWNSVSILLIIWTAILMYKVGDQAKAFLVIRNGMRRLLPNELILIMAMGWVLESFLQGITGFGVPVAVGAPLLIGLGVSPIWAVIIPLLGQAWGNTFGTLAAAWDALAISAGLSFGDKAYWSAALWSALFLFIWDIVTGMAICWFYGRGKALKKGFLAIIIIAIIQGFGELLLSQVNTTLACFLPSCVSMAAIPLIAKLKSYRDPWRLEDSPIMLRKSDISSANEDHLEMTLMQAYIPYLILSVLTLFVLICEPVRNFLGQFSLAPSFPETQTGYGFVNEASSFFSPLAIFTHASMFLFIASLVSIIYYKHHGFIKTSGLAQVLKDSFLMTKPSATAVVGLIVVSALMSGTGQTWVLANGMSVVLGKLYMIFSPFIGMIGTFITGSSMSSNILFGEFQMLTSNILGAPSAAVLGAQAAGSAIGSIISPSKIILGTTTANIAGQEGEIMKKLIGLVLISMLVIGLSVCAVGLL